MRLPGAVSVALPLGLWMLLLLWVIFPVPRFEKLFVDFGVRVPVVTELVFRVAAVVRQWPVATLGVLALFTAVDGWLDQSCGHPLHGGEGVLKPALEAPSPGVRSADRFCAAGDGGTRHKAQLGIA